LATNRVDTISALHNILGAKDILTDASDVNPYSQDWRRIFNGRPLAVVRPSNTREVSDVIKLCADLRIPLVPQGGNTGMVGGAVPSEDDCQIVLSLSGMNRIRDIDPVDMTMIVDAGVVLKAAQEAASAAGCMLPLSFSSEGSAQIGGVLATNAGGNNTVRHGTARDLVLGMEVVMPDGRIWNGLRRLRKDNAGYCLRQLFVGAEGTLGIITGAVLKLTRPPRQTALGLCAVPSPQAALDLLNLLQDNDPASLVAFEYMSNTGMGLVLQTIRGTVFPLPKPAPHYILTELATQRRDPELRADMTKLFETALQAGIIGDAAIAASVTDRQAMWRLREEQSEAQKRTGASIKNDVSVPVSKVPEFLTRAAEACEKVVQGIRVVPFGHIGDGNVHFNLVQPLGADPAEFMTRAQDLMEAVNEIVNALGGSFSAEHGIGQLKAYMMPAWRGGPELDAMRQIKKALDPLGLMNPGKVLG
jgi:FAD/FMN-containing dehydrogenase